MSPMSTGDTADIRGIDAELFGNAAIETPYLRGKLKQRLGHWMILAQQQLSSHYH